MRRLTQTDEHLWTAREVAEFLQVREKRVYELDLPQIRLAPRTVRFVPQEIRDWLNNRRTAA
jgi:predicted DNA-binding transcriptional regulator AlpA